MADMFTLGIDVGTTSVKAGLIDAAGNLRSFFSESYPTQREAPDRAEQNAVHWTTLIDKAINQFARDGYAPQIEAIGLCSQVNTHVFVGKDGKPLIPAISWQDGRASDHANALDNSVSEAQKSAWWGAPMPIDASNVLSRIAWMADQRPDVWEATKWVMLPKDFCLFHLTNAVTTDPLSNIGLVGPSLNYVPEVFDLVPGSAQKLAPLAPITETIGSVRNGSPLAGIPVVSGTMDAWAGIVGASGAKEKASVYLSGTSEILGITSQILNPTPGAIVFPDCNGLRIHAAPTQSGGDAKKWFAGIYGLSLDQMSKLVADTSHSGKTPLFLPQLEGERAPLWDSKLRAAFLGVSRRTGLGDFARAVYEGVAFAARHALETIQSSSSVKSKSIGCAGGGFRSNAWNQIRADILGVECQILSVQEPGILGAAMIAGVGVGTYDDLAQAHEALIRYDRMISPDVRQSQHYSSAFEIYKEAITTNANITARWSQIGGIDG
jgi:xylulokinase